MRQLRSGGEGRGLWCVAAAALVALGGVSTGCAAADSGGGESTPDVPDVSQPADTGVDVPEPVDTDGTDLEDASDDVEPDTGGTDGSDGTDPDTTDGADPGDGSDVPDVVDVPDVQDVAEVGTDGEDVPDGSTDGADVPDAGDTAVAGPCALPADCLDDDFCTKDLCTDGACVAEAASCDDQDPCTNDSCNPLVGCISVYAGGAGCTAMTHLFEASFDDGTTSGLQIEDLAKDPGDGSIVWVPDPKTTYTGAGALYFGRPGPYDFDNGKIVAAVARTPKIALPAGKKAQVSFHTWMDVEPENDWDAFTVSVLVDGQSKPVPVWSKTEQNVVMQQWQQVTVELTAFAGKSVQVFLTFDSIDADRNDTYGVVVDVLRISGLPTAKSCAKVEDCDDGIACSEDACVAGACTYEVAASCCTSATECSDGDACTIDICNAESVCENTPVAEPNCCNTDAECDDTNECTADKCQPNNICDHAVKDAPGCCTNAAKCDDKDKCTIDSCKNFMCQNVNTCCKSDAECNDGDDVCTTDSCVAGACKYAYKPIPGCCTPVVYEDTFEGGFGWTATGGAGQCKWQVVSGAKSKSPTSALYYGNPAAKNFSCGANAGNVLSPEITIPDKTGLSLEYDLWMHIESGGYDLLSVHLKTVGGGSSQVWSKGGEPMATWNHLKHKLDAFAGKTIQIEIKFDTLDSFANETEGVYVDDVKITDPCQ